MIFEDRVKEWFINIAEELKKNNEAGYVILMICIQYVESMIQFKKGEDSSGKSGEFFKDGIKDIFPEIEEDLINLLWSSVRCGLFHNGMTDDGIFINADKENNQEITLFKVKGENKVLINPHKFLDKINEHFKDYITKLKNPENIKLRENFEKAS